MGKVYITVLDFTTNTTHIYCVDNTGEDPDDTVANLGYDISYCQYMFSENYPLNIKETDILESTRYKLRDILCEKIKEAFVKQPDKLISFTPWDIYDGNESVTLTYNKEEGTFLIDKHEESLRDICTDDLAYILEKLEEK